MSNTKNYPPEKYLQLVLRRHVTLGVESIYASIFASINHDRISIYHILNELLAIIQMPISLVILDKNSEEYRLLNKFPLDKDQIERKVAESKENGTMYFDMWDTNYKLLVLMARPNKKTAEQNYSFDILEKIEDATTVINYWDAAAYKLKKILELDKYGAADRNRLRGIINDAICKIFVAKESSDSEDFENKYVSTKIKNEFYKSLTTDATEYQIEDNGIIDKLYKRVAANYREVTGAANTQKEGKICNFLLFNRDYTEHASNKKYYRHNAYKHCVQVLLCNTQKKEIVRYFEWLKIEQNYEAEFAKILNNLASCENKWVQDFCEISVEFKKVLFAVGGSDEIVKIIESPCSQEVRSIADSVFDGLSVYRTPFATDAGIRRYYPLKDRGILNGTNLSPEIDIQEDLKEKGEKRNDLLGLVALQFLFEAMSDDESNNSNLTIQVMLNPVEVGGRLWGVTCYVTKVPNLEDSKLQTEVQIEAFNKFWLQNYHIHHHVNQKMLRSLRSYMNTLYEKTVADVYRDWYDYLVTQPARLEVSDAEKVLNSMLFALTELFPYNAVSAKIKRLEPDEISVPSKDAPNMAYIGTKYGALVNVSDYSQFATPIGVDTSSLKGHVDNVDVAIRITEKFMLSALMAYAVESKQGAGSSGRVLQ